MRAAVWVVVGLCAVVAFSTKVEQEFPDFKRFGVEGCFIGRSLLSAKNISVMSYTHNIEFSFSSRHKFANVGGKWLGRRCLHMAAFACSKRMFSADKPPSVASKNLFDWLANVPAMNHTNGGYIFCRGLSCIGHANGNYYRRANFELIDPDPGESEIGSNLLLAQLPGDRYRIEGSLRSPLGLNAEFSGFEKCMPDIPNTKASYDHGDGRGNEHEFSPPSHVLLGLKIIFFALSSFLFLWIGNWGMTTVADRGYKMIPTYPIWGRFQWVFGIFVFIISACAIAGILTWLASHRFSHEGP